jgi:hypothetical protein
VNAVAVVAVVVVVVVMVVAVAEFERREKHTKFLLGCLKGRDDPQDLRVEGRTSKLIQCNSVGCCEIDASNSDRAQRRHLVKKAITG